MRKIKFRAAPAVAGSDATKEARFIAGREGVLLVTDGVMENLEAVQQYLSASA
ncbi:MAG: hypothetical protein HPY54_07865 [Chthonomonadetes bacterium]|nr:hypothetical protein [Chthonomonadetes bacterium]